MKLNKMKIMDRVVEIIMLLSSIIILVPILIMLSGSLKTNVEAASATLSLPSVWKFDNYLYVLKEGKMLSAFLNSVLIAFISVAVTLIFSSACGFILSRKKTAAARKLYRFILIGMIAPMQIVTTFILMKLIHFSGYASVIAIYVATNIPFSVLLFEGFTGTIPSDIDESAVIDGCGPLRMFFAIIFPLMLPVSMTNIITISIGIWNDFMIPLFLLTSSKYWTLPLTVYNFFGQYASDWNYVFANLVLTATPIVIVFLLLQKYIIAGMTAGAIKG